MIDEVYEFLESVLNDTQYDRLVGALTVLDSYSPGSVIYVNMVSLISDSGYTSDEKVMYIERMVNEDLNAILLAHGIQLSEEAGLDDRVEILYALYVLQHLDSYEEVSRWLESQEDDIELLGGLIEDYSTLSRVRVYEVVERLSEGFIEGLKRYARDREQEQVDTHDRTFKQRADLIKKYVTEDCLILKSGLKLGGAYKSYLGLLSDELNALRDGKVDGLVKELLCILLLSAEGLVDTRGQWEKYIGDYIQDANDSVKADVVYHQLLQRFLDGLKAEQTVV